MSKYDTSRKYSLRDVIGNYMKTLGEKNADIVVVNADLMGTCRNGGFVSAFPHRAFNTGIAEQNMVSFAAGLAHEGYIPYAFSMAPFLSMRACEQCRTDIAYADLNVRLMGTYAGYSGGISGATHWALEDCAIFSSMGGMTVLEISDPYQAEKVLDISAKYRGSMYIRSGVEPVAPIYDEMTQFEIGKAKIVHPGEDVAIICSGITVSFALEAAKVLNDTYGVSVRVIDMFTLKPLDKTAIIDAAQTGNIIVAQDHNKHGGLGSMVSTVLAENKMSVNFKILGCNEKYETMAHANYLYRKNGYDTEGLVQAVIQMLGLDIDNKPEDKRDLQRGIVVTGATSMLGAALIDVCVEQNIPVLAIVRRGTTRIDRIAKSHLVKVLEANTDEWKTIETATQYDAFYHFAWDGTTGSLRNDCVRQEKNIGITLEAVNLAKRFGCKVFVGAGSQAEYGLFEGKLNSLVATNPNTPYGNCKLAAGNLSRLAARQAGVEHVWVRIVSVYGPNDNDNTMVMSTIHKLQNGETPKFTKGEQMWDYLYSKDAATAFFKLAINGIDGKTYVLGSGKAKPLADYIEEIRCIVAPDAAVEMGVIPYASNQVMHLCADISELTKDIGWTPQWEFKDGIKEIIGSQS